MPIKQVHFVSQDTDPVDTEEFNSVVFDGIKKSTLRTEAYRCCHQTRTMCWPNYKPTCKVDSGRQANILPLCTYKIFPDSLTPDGRPTRSQPSGDILTAYNGSSIKHYGTITMPCRYKDGNWSDATFYIVEMPGPVIFGLPTGIVLNLLQMNRNVNVSSQQAQKILSTSHLQNMYSDCCKGLAKFAGTYRLTLK